MIICTHVDIILSPWALRQLTAPVSTVVEMPAGSVGAVGQVLSWFYSIAVDDIVDFGHHEKTDHFLRPALEVLPIEARDVGDRESCGRLVAGHVDC